MRRIFMACCLLLAACNETPPPAPLEPLRFTGPSYTLGVANISIVQDYKSPKRPPNVEHLADITPAQAARQWAGIRLVAAGHQNSLEVDITDASIIRTDLPKQKTGIEGMFTTEQTEQYDGTLQLEIRVYSSNSALAVARLSATANQRLTLPENASAADRERLYHEMTIDLMREIEPELDTNIHRYLRNYLL